MKLKHLFYIGTLIALLSGCGTRVSDSQAKSDLSPVSLPKLVQSDSSFRFAYTGRVFSKENGEPIPNFTIELLNASPSISGVINGLGNYEGVFHLSRKEKGSVLQRVAIFAPGYEPLVQNIEVGSNCESNSCVNKLNQELFLEKSPTPTQSFSLKDYLPQTVRQKSQLSNRAEIFQNLVDEKKLDDSVKAQLLSASQNQALSNVMVVLKDTQSSPAIVSELLNQVPVQNNSNLFSFLNNFVPNSSQGNSSLATLLGELMGSFLPSLAASNPQIAAGLGAAKLLIPYLEPFLGKLFNQQKSGPFGEFLASLLKGVSGSTLAMPGLNLFPSPSQPPSLFDSQNPLGSLLSSLLNLPQIQNKINPNSITDPKLAAAIPYLQTLIQGMISKDATQIKGSFNELLSQLGGLSGLQNFPTDLSSNGSFNELLPYLEPLIAGLNGPNGQALSEFLFPILQSSNPAEALLSFVFSQSPSSSTWLNLASILFPSLGGVAGQSVNNKQLLVSQLLEGLINGSFKKLTVAKDLPNSSAVVVNASALDIFHLAQLPNVQKLVQLR